MSTCIVDVDGSTRPGCSCCSVVFGHNVKAFLLPCGHTLSGRCLHRLKSHSQGRKFMCPDSDCTAYIDWHQCERAFDLESRHEWPQLKDLEAQRGGDDGNDDANPVACPRCGRNFTNDKCRAFKMPCDHVLCGSCIYQVRKNFAHFVCPADGIRVDFRAVERQKQLEEQVSGGEKRSGKHNYPPMPKLRWKGPTVTECPNCDARFNGRSSKAMLQGCGCLMCGSCIFHLRKGFDTYTCPQCNSENNWKVNQRQRALEEAASKLDEEEQQLEEAMMMANNDEDSEASDSSSSSSTRSSSRTSGGSSRSSHSQRYGSTPPRAMSISSVGDSTSLQRRGERTLSSSSTASNASNGSIGGGGGGGGGGGSYALIDSSVAAGERSVNYHMCDLCQRVFDSHTLPSFRQNCGCVVCHQCMHAHADSEHKDSFSCPVHSGSLTPFNQSAHKYALEMANWETWVNGLHQRLESLKEVTLDTSGAGTASSSSHSGRGKGERGLLQNLTGRGNESADVMMTGSGSGDGARRFYPVAELNTSSPATQGEGTLQAIADEVLEWGVDSRRRLEVVVDFVFDLSKVHHGEKSVESVQLLVELDNKRKTHKRIYGTHARAGHHMGNVQQDDTLLDSDTAFCDRMRGVCANAFRNYLEENEECHSFVSKEDAECLVNTVAQLHLGANMHPEDVCEYLDTLIEELPRENKNGVDIAMLDTMMQTSSAQMWQKYPKFMREQFARLSEQLTGRREQLTAGQMLKLSQIIANYGPSSDAAGGSGPLYGTTSFRFSAVYSTRPHSNEYTMTVTSSSSVMFHRGEHSSGGGGGDDGVRSGGAGAGAGAGGGSAEDNESSEGVGEKKTATTGAGASGGGGGDGMGDLACERHHMWGTHEERVGKVSLSPNAKPYTPKFTRKLPQPQQVEYEAGNTSYSRDQQDELNDEDQEGLVVEELDEGHTSSMDSVGLWGDPVIQLVERSETSLGDEEDEVMDGGRDKHAIVHRRNHGVTTRTSTSTSTASYGSSFWNATSGLWSSSTTTYTGTLSGWSASTPASDLPGSGDMQGQESGETSPGRGNGGGAKDTAMDDLIASLLAEIDT